MPIVFLAAMFIGMRALAQFSPALTVELNNWHDQSREACAEDAECRRIVKQYFDDALACIEGDAIACGRREKNLGDINRLNAERRNAWAREQKQGRDEK
jgi:hypothetical protein